jgi:hypothetical protein
MKRFLFLLILSIAVTLPSHPATYVNPDGIIDNK